MKISVITVCYNSAATIADTFASVAAQSHPDIEHIVIDGGSTDGTVDIIKRHQPQIAHLVSRRPAKVDNRMGRNFLHGKDGDHMNALLAGSGFNLRKLLRELSRVFFWLRLVVLWALCGHKQPISLARSQVAFPAAA